MTLKLPFSDDDSGKLGKKIRVPESMTLRLLFRLLSRGNAEKTCLMPNTFTDVTFSLSSWGNSQKIRELEPMSLRLLFRMMSRGNSEKKIRVRKPMTLRLLFRLFTRGNSEKTCLMPNIFTDVTFSLLSRGNLQKIRVLETMSLRLLF